MSSSWRLTVFLWQASTGVFLISLVQQYLPQELDAGASFSGFALAAYAAARFALQAPAGWLADRLGRRRTLTLGIAVSLPSIYLMFQVQDATSFLAFSALYGAGSAAVWPSIMAHIGDTQRPERRGRTLNVLNISQLLGLGVGTMAGVTLLDLISYQAAFIACMVFSGLALAFAYRGARDESQGATQPAEDIERARPAVAAHVAGAVPGRDRAAAEHRLDGAGAGGRGVQQRRAQDEDVHARIDVDRACRRGRLSRLQVRASVRPVRASASARFAGLPWRRAATSR